MESSPAQNNSRIDHTERLEAETEKPINPSKNVLLTGGSLSTSSLNSLTGIPVSCSTPKSYAGGLFNSSLDMLNISKEVDLFGSTGIIAEEINFKLQSEAEQEAERSDENPAKESNHKKAKAKRHSQSKKRKRGRPSKSANTTLAERRQQYRAIARDELKKMNLAVEAMKTLVPGIRKNLDSVSCSSSVAFFQNPFSFKVIF